MTEKDKKLLLADLCSRLPYGIIVRCDKYKNLPDVPCFEYKGKGMFKLYADELPIEVEFIKPYLRPLSSMTEEEINELKTKFDFYIKLPGWKGDNKIVNLRPYGIGQHLCTNVDNLLIGKLIDWLNAHHFDYRGLIPMGIALRAPEDMYNF